MDLNLTFEAFASSQTPKSFLVRDLVRCGAVKPGSRVYVQQSCRQGMQGSRLLNTILEKNCGVIQDEATVFLGESFKCLQDFIKRTILFLMSDHESVLDSRKHTSAELRKINGKIVDVWQDVMVEGKFLGRCREECNLEILCGVGERAVRGNKPASKKKVISPKGWTSLLTLKGSQDEKIRSTKVGSRALRVRPPPAPPKNNKFRTVSSSPAKGVKQQAAGAVQGKGGQWKGAGAVGFGKGRSVAVSQDRGVALAGHKNKSPSRDWSAQRRAAEKAMAEQIEILCHTGDLSQIDFSLFVNAPRDERGEARRWIDDWDSEGMCDEYANEETSSRRKRKGLGDENDSDLDERQKEQISEVCCCMLAFVFQYSCVCEEGKSVMGMSSMSCNSTTRDKAGDSVLGSNVTWMTGRWIDLRRCVHMCVCDNVFKLVVSMLMMGRKRRKCCR